MPSAALSIEHNDRRAARIAASRTVREFAAISHGYWQGTRTRPAWLLTAGVLALVIAGIVMQVGINRWNGMFFDAMEQKNWSRLLEAIWLILGLAAAMAVAGAAYVQVKMRLQVRWRQWLTSHLVERWLADRRFYRLSVANGSGISNPEYRIADDVRNATEPLVDFLAALTTAVLTAATFIGILWYVGGSLAVEVRGLSIVIPGFMVVGVLLYSVCATALMVHVGRPLIARIETRNTSEAGFRYGLTRTRENAEQIALAGSDSDERRRLDEILSELMAKWIEVIRREARMTFLTNGTMTLTPAIPLLLCAPKYLEGQLTLGEMVQITAAFMQVHQSLNWLADNAIRVAEWLASAQRVVAFAESLDGLDAADAADRGNRIRLEETSDKSIRLEHLAITEPSGKMLICGPELTFAQGQNVLIRGPSGAGKSTLVRAMAGLWPWGTGTIRKPSGARMSFLLQRPLLPHGTLRQALLYPAENASIIDSRLVGALQRCGLSHLANRLDEEEQWANTLQGGEQQRLAFARLLIDPPDVLIMDEATSALDELSEARMLEFLSTDLARTTVICVGRRAGLERYFDRQLCLVADPATGVSSLQEVPPQGGPRSGC